MNKWIRTIKNIKNFLKEQLHNQNKFWTRILKKIAVTGKFCFRSHLHKNAGGRLDNFQQIWLLAFLPNGNYGCDCVKIVTLLSFRDTSEWKVVLYTRIEVLEGNRGGVLSVQGVASGYSKLFNLTNNTSNQFLSCQITFSFKWESIGEENKCF